MSIDDHGPMSSVHYLFGETPAVAVTWQEKVAGARTEEGLVRVANEYLAEWAPSELALLPSDCRPGRIVDGEQIAFYAYSLIRRQCGSEASSSELHRMATFFSTAAHRQSQLRTAANRGSEPESQSA